VIDYLVYLPFVETSEDAVDVITEVCVDQAMESVTAAILTDAYANGEGTFPTMVELSMVDVDCEISESDEDVLTNGDGVTIAPANIICTATTFREETQGELSAGDSIAKVLETFENTTAGVSFFVSVVTAISELSDTACGDSLNDNVEDVIANNRRRLDEDVTLRDVLLGGEVESIAVTSTTANPTAVPSANPTNEPSSLPTYVPSFAPTESPTSVSPTTGAPSVAPSYAPSVMPTGAPTGQECSSDEDCPEGQTCVFSRRRKLLFGYTTGICK